MRLMLVPTCMLLLGYFMSIPDNRGCLPWEKTKTHVVCNIYPNSGQLISRLSNPCTLVESKDPICVLLRFSGPLLGSWGYADIGVVFSLRPFGGRHLGGVFCPPATFEVIPRDSLLTFVAKWVFCKIEQEGQTAGVGPCSHLPGQPILEFRCFEPQPTGNKSFIVVLSSSQVSMGPRS